MRQEFYDILNKLGWSEDRLISFLEKYYVSREKKKERDRKYFQNNKQKFYNYHKEYRRTHPEYVKRKIALDKKRKEELKATNPEPQVDELG